MLIRTPRSVATTAAAAVLVSSLGLAGCSSGSNATVTHTPALQTFGGRNTARSSVQTAILVADTSNGIALPGGPTPAGLARRVFAMVRAGRRASATGGSTGACTGGTKTSQVTNADLSLTTTTDFYYEPVCTTLEAEETINVVAPGSPNTTGTGQIISYDKSGGIRLVQKLTFGITTTAANATPANSETFTLLDSGSLTAGGTATSGLGATCTGVPPSTTVSCTVSHYGTSASTGFGEVITTAATAPTTAGANTTANVAVSFFASNTLQLVLSSGVYTLSGTPFNAATGTYAFAKTGPSGSGTFSIADQLYTYAVTGTLASTGLTISIIQNPNSAFPTTSPIATATVDVAGTGVLTYSDGTTEPIAGGLIGY